MKQNEKQENQDPKNELRLNRLEGGLVIATVKRRSEFSIRVEGWRCHVCEGKPKMLSRHALENRVAHKA